MPLSRLNRVDVVAFHLEIPFEDFEALPRELGCCLHRHGDSRLTLATEAAGCALDFEVEGPRARLVKIAIEQDPDAEFTRDVLGLLMQLYSGDLEVALRWDRAGAYASHLSIVGGETSHPLLVVQEPQEAPFPEDFSMDLVDRCIDEGRAAWGEYVRHKQGREKPAAKSGAIEEPQ